MTSRRRRCNRLSAEWARRAYRVIRCRGDAAAVGVGDSLGGGDGTKNVAANRCLDSRRNRITRKAGRGRDGEVAGRGGRQSGTGISRRSSRRTGTGRWRGEAGDKAGLGSAGGLPAVPGRGGGGERRETKRDWDRPAVFPPYRDGEVAGRGGRQSGTGIGRWSSRRTGTGRWRGEAGDKAGLGSAGGLPAVPGRGGGGGERRETKRDWDRPAVFPPYRDGEVAGRGGRQSGTGIGRRSSRRTGTGRWRGEAGDKAGLGSAGGLPAVPGRGGGGERRETKRDWDRPAVFPPYRDGEVAGRGGRQSGTGVGWRSSRRTGTGRWRRGEAGDKAGLGSAGGLPAVLCRLRSPVTVVYTYLRQTRGACLPRVIPSSHQLHNPHMSRSLAIQPRPDRLNKRRASLKGAALED